MSLAYVAFPDPSSSFGTKWLNRSKSIFLTTAELYAFHWLVKHNRMQGLGAGFALDGSLIHMSHTRAKQILADMPYVDEDFYHQYRWYKPIPAPRAYGDMIVTATSRWANLNEQPRRLHNAGPLHREDHLHAGAMAHHDHPHPEDQIRLFLMF